MGALNNVKDNNWLIATSMLLKYRLVNKYYIILYTKRFSTATCSLNVWIIEYKLRWKFTLNKIHFSSWKEKEWIIKIVKWHKKLWYHHNILCIVWMYSNNLISKHLESICICEILKLGNQQKSFYYNYRMKRYFLWWHDHFDLLTSYIIDHF